MVVKQREALEGGIKSGQVKRKKPFWEFVFNIWSSVFLLFLLIYFSILARGFFTLSNFQSIGMACSQNLLMALGETFVIISGGIDLSAGYVMGLASVVSAVIMREFYPTGVSNWLLIPLAMGCGISVATIAGTINGVIVAKLKIPSFIATLGMLGIARGAALILTGGPPVGGQPPVLGDIGNGYLFYYSPHAGYSFFNAFTLEGEQLRQVLSFMPNMVALAAIIVFVCYLILSKTLFGQHTYAVGGNLEAARRSGIQVDRHLIKIYALSGMLSGIGGQFYLMRFTSGSAVAGEPLLLTSIAAVVIGGASLFGGEGTIWGTVIGAVIIAVLETGFVIQGINPFYQYIAVGVVIILAVLIDRLKARFEGKRRVGHGE